MKGGLVSNDLINIGDFLFNNIANVNVTPFGQRSVGGFLFKIEFAPSISTNFVSVYPGIANVVSHTKSFLLKIVQINDAAQPGQKDPSYNKEIVTTQTFNKEVTIQNQIYNSSMDCWCEPICPTILESGTISDYTTTSIGKFISQTQVIHQLVHPNIAYLNKLGYIIMEMLENSKPISTSFPDWNPNNKPVEPNLSQTQHRILENYVYQLIRLNQLGFKHGDTHLDNGLYVENYDYLNNYRVYLIDFGRTNQIIIDPNNPNQHKFNVNYICNYDLDVNGNIYWSYRQLINYLIDPITHNPYTPTELEQIYNNKTSIVLNSMKNFVEKLFNRDVLREIKKLSTTHSILKKVTTDIIFKTNNIPLMNFTSCNLSLNMNQSSVGCLTLPPPDNSYVRANNTYLTYGQEIITFVRDNHFVSYVDEHISLYPDKYGMFLWIIGIDPKTQNPRIYFALIESCFEFVIKHATLMQHYGITNIYAAGEMAKRDNELNFNFLSGTYMITPYMNGMLNNSVIDSLNNVLVPFVDYKLNRPTKKFNIQSLHNPGTSILNDVQIIAEPICCQDANYKVQQSKYFNYINTLFEDNQREQVFEFTRENPLQQIIIGGKEKTEVNINESLQNDIDNGMKQIITINDLWMNDLNTKLSKIIDEETNTNFQNNIQILSEYAAICCKNSFNTLINDIDLKDSKIKEKIILMNDKIVNENTKNNIAKLPSKLPYKLLSKLSPTKLPSKLYLKSSKIPIKQKTGGYNKKTLKKVNKKKTKRLIKTRLSRKTY